MSDRYHALTVLLDPPLKDEDALGLIEAIRHLRGVVDVQPHVADVDTYWAQEAARRQLIQEMYAVLTKRSEPS